MFKHDEIKSPNYYKWHPLIECKDVIKFFCWPLGNAIKYIWRAGKKDGETAIKDLQKAQECIQIKIDQINNIKK